MIISAILYFYDYVKKNYIDLTLISEVQTDEELPGTWWGFVFNAEGNSLVEHYNLVLPATDYNENILIVSGGRKLDSLWYRKYSKLLTKSHHNNPYLGSVKLNKSLHSHTIYIYKIKKINILDDEYGY